MESAIDNIKVSIIIPCYNEDGNIELLYKKIKEVLKDTKVEYVFIDDNSNDETLSVLEKLSKQDSMVKYLSFSRNFGHQNALRAGLEYSTGDCIISMDADLQHPPELLPTLIEKWKEGYYIVYTIRKDIENVSTFKRVTAAMFYKLMNFLSDIEIQQGAADFRLLDKKL